MNISAIDGLMVVMRGLAKCTPNVTALCKTPHTKKAAGLNGHRDKSDRKGKLQMPRWTNLSEQELAAKSAKNRALRSKPAERLVFPWEQPIQQIAPTLQSFTLPYPPTVNHYWLPNANHSKRISSKGLKFRADVIHACRGLDGVMGRVGVHVEAFPPDHRKRDLDNLFKALLDALSHAGMIEDDSLIDALSIERFEVEKGGKVIVTITPRYP